METVGTLRKVVSIFDEATEFEGGAVGTVPNSAGVAENVTA